MSSTDDLRFRTAIRKIDEANKGDPNIELYLGKEYPKELLYSIRMSEWLDNIRPDASEALKLAARAQHICRWEIPRSDYPMDRVGYLKWRTGLYGFHARRAAAILREVGYEDGVIGRVEVLLQKKNIKTDPEMQTLEDVICLVFLENYFTSFSEKHDKDKIIGIIRKTWKKMSPEGHSAALKIPMSPPAKALVEKAFLQ